jgi:hypothetical protein
MRSRLDLFFYAVAAALVVGAFPLPYGYYMLLRVLACAAFGYAAFLAYKSKAWPTLAMLALATVAFNPLIPLRLSKAVWAAVDMSAGAYLAVLAKHLVSRFTGYQPPRKDISDIGGIVGFGVVFGAIGSIGLALFVGMLTIPLKWLGLFGSAEALNIVFLAVFAGIFVAVVTSYAYHSGSPPRKDRGV